MPSTTESGAPVPTSPASEPFTITADRVLLPDRIGPATLDVHAGRIASVRPGVDPTADVRYGSDIVLMPGIVDTHVHLNDPGRTEWEGFAAGTSAAVAGGATTLIDMPLNSIPVTTTVDALRIKQASARGRVYADVGFWGGAVPQNLGSLRELWDAGVFGFKCFTSGSGIPEFDSLGWDQVEEAMREIARFDGLLIVHAEDPDLLGDAGPLGREYETFLHSRPDAAEASAVRKVVDRAERTGARVHLLHVSSRESLPIIRAAKDRGVRVTAETCPHYLTISADRIPAGDTAFKCCPPIRDAAAQDALWAALLDGTLDIVVTDHSPATRELKYAHDGDWGLAWGGISSLQVSLAAVWTEARRRGVSLRTVHGWMSAATARFAGLGDRGVIEPGARADLVAFADGEPFEVRAGELFSRNPVTAFDGAELVGRVRQTWLNGRLAFAGGVPTAPTGRLVPRPA